MASLLPFSSGLGGNLAGPRVLNSICDNRFTHGFGQSDQAIENILISISQLSALEEQRRNSDSVGLDGHDRPDRTVIDAEVIDHHAATEPPHSIQKGIDFGDRRQRCRTANLEDEPGAKRLVLSKA